MRVFHLTVKTLRGSADLTEPAIAAELWHGMRRAFPDALAACIMPDHPHLLTPAGDASDARQRLGHGLSGLRRSKAGADTRWESVADPGEISDRTKLARNVRYIALNPCRDGSCSDPLAWLWSTHRDVVGATVDPWPTAAHLARVLDRNENDFARRHHAYASSDPSVATDGTPFPEPAARTELPSYGIELFVAAAAAATRSVPDPSQFSRAARAQFLRLAYECGWRDFALLAAAAGMCPSGARCNLRDAQTDITPGLLCLGDERLRAAIAPKVRGFAQKRGIWRPHARRNSPFRAVSP